MERWILAFLLLGSARYLGFVARVVASFRRVNDITDQALAQTATEADCAPLSLGRNRPRPALRSLVAHRRRAAPS